MIELHIFFYTLKVNVADFRPDSTLPIKAGKDVLSDGSVYYLVIIFCDVKCVKRDFTIPDLLRRRSGLP